jgi:Gpi18-like mannosyltransferase
MSPFSLIIILVVLFPLAPDAVAQNLLKNPDFEEATETRPSYWEYDTWIKDRNTAQIGLTTRDSHSAKTSIEIDVFEPDDVKVMQKIEVLPNRIYLFSCWVKARGIPTGAKGANLSALGILDTSESLYDTSGQWRELRFYGRTGPDQREVVFTIRIGGYGSLNKGKALFDDCIAEVVNTVPNGVQVANLSPLKGQPGPERSYTGWIVGILIFAIFGFLGYRYLSSPYWQDLTRFLLKPEGDETPNTKGLWTRYYILIALSFLAKFVLALISTGYPVDVITFKAWSDLLARDGFSAFYYGSHFVDYPPLYMYVFYVVGKVRLWLDIGFESQWFLLLVKLPSLIAELLSVVVLLRLLKSSRTGDKRAYLAPLLFAFNPALVIDSALWGQSDSVLALLVAVSLVLLTQNRSVAATITFSCAVLMKPQALMFTPIFIFYFYRLRDWSILLKAFLASLAMMVLIVLPFSVSHGPYWIIKIFKNALEQYPYATLNAFNFYALIGKNWAPVDSTLILPIKYWGAISLTLITALSGLMYLRSNNPHRILLIALFILVSVFMFSTKMHERYMIPALLLFSLLYVFIRDKRLLYLIAGFTLTNTVNLGYTLAFAHQGIYHLSADDAILRVCSAVNLALYVFLVKWVWTRLFGETKSPVTKDTGRLSPFLKGLSDIKQPFSPDLSVGPRDWLWALIIAFCYCLLVFYNLGSIKSPQTYWRPGVTGESFYVDLGQPKEIGKVLFFSGIGTGRYRVDVSEDLVRWTTVGVFNQKSPFQWKTLRVRINHRYLSIVTEEVGGVLLEIGLFDTTGRLLNIRDAIPFAVSPLTLGSVRNLFDEQWTVPERPAYMNSMYFDEIYFARTAYEHLHKMEPYENTHPPLGKLLMAAGVKVFGMTPFGWRFAGALAGVILVVTMFFMGRLLFGTREAGLLCSALMGLDFMTYVQSRLATVDIFAVLFIVLMYYFMFRFYLMAEVAHKRAMIDLALSGLFFGLGAATKWLCLYGGLGLGIIYLHRLYRESRSLPLQKTPQGKDKKRKQQDAVPIRPLLIKYALYGLVFFVALPIVIYTMSFIPFMMLPGPGHDLLSVFDYQIHMYQYHKSVKGSHPFASRWWQWPLIIKPMWLYMGEDLPAGKAASIVTMGNPVIWWSGLIGVLVLLYLGVVKKALPVVGGLIIVGVASNYGPWVFVPREVYIYHFFATVPFMVLGLVYWLRLFGSVASKSVKYIPYGFVGCSLLLFVVFYPILSGMPIDKTYMQHLRWFNSWIFFIP